MAEFVELANEKELKDFVSEGKTIVFKHSNSCPISYFVKQDVATISEKVGIVVVQSSRSLSSFIADETGIRHESPQALLFEDGKCFYSASHYDISSDKIVELVK